MKAPGLAGQQQEGAFQFLELAQAAHRDGVADIRLALVAVEVGVVHLGLEVTRCDGVDPHVEARQFQRQGFAQLHHAGLGRTVVAVAAAHAQAEDRGDVDDAAAAPGLGQALRCALGDAPDAVEVGGEHGAPVFLADFQSALAVADAGIVQHHVDHAELRLGAVERGLDTGTIGHVQYHGVCLSALGLNGLCKLRQPLGAPRREHYAGASLRSHAGQMGADTAGGAGDQHSLAGEGEKIVAHGSSLVGQA